MEEFRDTHIFIYSYGKHKDNTKSHTTRTHMQSVEFFPLYFR